jgi:ABC-type transport system substrate-binding protein
MTHPCLRQLLLGCLCALQLGLGAAPAAAQPTEPKVLRVARTAQFESLDPPRQFDEASHGLIDMLYDTLLTYSYLERPYKLEPRLLARLPDLSADRLTLTFTLRKGVMFHDNPCFAGGKGRELVADDVLYSLRRFADANINNKSWFLMEGAVVGLDEFRAATRKAGPLTDTGAIPVTGLKKLDPYTFSLTLTHPNPLLLYAFATAASAIVPVEAVQRYKDQFSVNPVGTGPFTLKDVERKGTLRLLKNPRYFGVYPSRGAPGDAEKGLLKDAGKRLPLVDVVEMPLIEEPQPAALKFLKGEIELRGLDRANFSKLVVRKGEGQFVVADEYASRFDIYWVPGLDTAFFGLNMKDPVLGGNKPLRQALAHLMDAKGVIETLSNGRGRKLNSLVPYDLPGAERDTAAAGRAYDVAAAKKLLAQAGYPDGKGLAPLTVSYGGTSADTRTGFDFMKAKFAAAGVQLKGDFTDFPTFLRNLERGNTQIYASGWVADYPDAENFYQLLYSKNRAPGPNRGSFSNEAYDKAYEASRTMANGPERYALFKNMNDIIQEEVPVILESNSLRFGITQKWLLNFKRNLMVAEYAFVDIDNDRKGKGP